jgi:hypothetical protein
MAKMFFLFALLPFISPLPIETDVQPVFLIIAALIFLQELAKGKLKYNRSFALLLTISIIVALSSFVAPDVPLQNRVGLLAALATYYIVVTRDADLSAKLLLTASSINFLGVVWNFVSPETFVTIAGNVVRVIKTQELSYRGVSGFAAEPSFTAAVALTHSLIAIYLNMTGRLKRRFMLLSILTSLVVVLITKSGLGVVYGLLLILIYCFFANWKAVLVSVVLLFTLSVAILNSNLAQSRGVSLLTNAWSNPSNFLSDGSVAERMFGVHIGVLSLIEYPLGNGSGSYSSVASRIDSKYSLQELYSSARPQLMETSSSFGRYLVELGVIFVIWMALLFRPAVGWTAFNISCVSLSFLFVLTTFSIAFPPTYILLGLAFQNKKIIKARKYALASLVK